MSHDRPQPKIVFLNQVCGPLFRELAEDLSQKLGAGLLITGNAGQIRNHRSQTLHILDAPEYDRGGNVKRLWTWLRYFFFTLRETWRRPSSAVIFIVSNPPFLPLIGYLMRKIRGQPYAVLVYDIYPDLLVRFGKLSENGVITRLWRRFNRRMLEGAGIVFTIGDCMAANLESMFDSSKTGAKRVVVVPNWADTGFVRPIPKEENRFAEKHGQRGRLTVLYSGNLGATHDIETMLKAAERFREDPRLHFMIIGEGTKRGLVQKTIAEGDLKNVTLLPFQPEEVLPFSLTTGDVAVVTLDRGAEGLSYPSKTFYAMAAGSAVLAVASGENDLSRLVEKHDFGMVVEPGDVDGMVEALHRFLSAPEFLKSCRERSRRSLEKSFTRDNTMEYLAALREAGFVSPSNATPQIGAGS